MVSQETMMFRFGADENKAENIIRNACSSMEKKGYNPINQLVGYLLSGDLPTLPATRMPERRFAP